MVIMAVTKIFNTICSSYTNLSAPNTWLEAIKIRYMFCRHRTQITPRCTLMKMQFVIVLDCFHVFWPKHHNHQENSLNSQSSFQKASLQPASSLSPPIRLCQSQ